MGRGDLSVAQKSTMLQSFTRLFLALLLRDPGFYGGSKPLKGAILGLTSVILHLQEAVDFGGGHKIQKKNLLSKSASRKQKIRRP